VILEVEGSQEELKQIIDSLNQVNYVQAQLIEM